MFYFIQNFLSQYKQKQQATKIKYSNLIFDSGIAKKISLNNNK